MSYLRNRVWVIVPCVVVLGLLGSAAPTQNLEFRLLTIERRFDQLQGRVEAIDRELRMQALRSTSRPEATIETIHEVQRQQLSLAEQVVDLQRRMLTLQKALDILLEKKDEPADKPVEKPKRKPQGT